MTAQDKVKKIVSLFKILDEYREERYVSFDGFELRHDPGDKGLDFYTAEGDYFHLCYCGEISPLWHPLLDTIVKTLEAKVGEGIADVQFGLIFNGKRYDLVERKKNGRS